ncbi:hypothetical protein O181_023984 [Austropuccinia psidii MF-1]|uniref:Integrase catalytic domain-containing protein n=1 Tax=Austropuccinia psidii MF-1 TaxID=1389203 RepID=A0A9Q3GZ78_9BASI|nr:hypothetical protein [Austropuccinia psidii MF-1]
MTFGSRLFINTILHECHDSINSGDLSEERKIENIKNYAWWKYWRKETMEYCHTCDRFQNTNESTSKKFGLMIHIEELKSPCEVGQMDWVIELPSSGDKRSNSCLVIIERYRKTPILLSCHKDDTAMDTALLLWNIVISHTELFNNIIHDRYHKLTYALWTNFYRLFGTKSAFSTEYHPKADYLAERMIQTLEEVIRRSFVYVSL